MEFLKRVLDTFFSFKAYVMLPAVILILALIIRMKVGEALLASLKVAVGFAGIFIVFGVFVSNIGPAVQTLIARRGLDYPILDVGWPPLAAITWASKIAPLSIPLVILVNLAMLATNTTRTIDIDVWNYWHFALVGALLQQVTGSFLIGLAATVLIAVYAIKLADWSAPLVDQVAGLKGISITTLSVNGLHPVGVAVDALILIKAPPTGGPV
jgi:PTS system galactitol-specific IIC component